MITTSPFGTSSGTTGNVVTVPGDLLSTNIATFRDLVMPICDRLVRGTALTIDLRAARLVDSVGLNLIVSVIKCAKSHEAEVRLLVGQPSVRRILSFTRIDTHAEVIGPDQS